MILPDISVEQNNILIALKNNNNVVVDSVAGSGKTTCNLHIATIFNNLNILLLTYNSKLKIETREKVNKLRLENLEVHTYHSFCVKYYDNECFNDTLIIKLLKMNKNIKKKCNYDLIILDEAQDITPTYFELICKIYRDNDIDAKICLLGDRNQSIYDFNKADERFIVYAERIFNFNKNFWSECKLTESFRITSEMSEFINNCMFNYSRIKSNKKKDFKPRYIICDTFGEINVSIPFEEVKYYLSLNYKPDDIFILAPSIKNSQGPIRRLENKIKTELFDIPIYVPLSDDEKIDADILTNKMVFSTFHQTKGLERKVVIIFNFDDSYFKLYKKDQNPKKCPNELYVATTRASERLTILHHYASNYLPFINKNNVSIYTEFIVKTSIKIKEFKEKIIDTGVTDLIKHLSQDVIDECMNYLKIEIINEKKTHIKIDTKTKQPNGYENVSEITGTAIPAYFEYKLNNKMSIYDDLPKNNLIFNDKLFIDSDDEDNVYGNKKEDIIKIDINNIQLDTIKEDELLYIANRWSAYKSGFIFKTFQITDYNWLSNENLNLCIDRLYKLNISKNAEFEKRFYVENKVELSNRKIIGYFDCIDNNNVYEFKCVCQLEKEHYLQLACYMYLYESEKYLKYTSYNFSIDDEVSYKENNIEKVGKIVHIYKNGKIKIKNCKNSFIKNEIIKITNYYLYNILSDELIKINCNFDNLKKMIEFLIISKYSNVKIINDDSFISNTHNISKNYL